MFVHCIANMDLSNEVEVNEHSCMKYIRSVWTFLTVCERWTCWWQAQSWPGLLPLHLIWDQSAQSALISCRRASRFNYGQPSATFSGDCTPELKSIGNISTNTLQLHLEKWDYTGEIRELLLWLACKTQSEKASNRWVISWMYEIVRDCTRFF